MPFKFVLPLPRFVFHPLTAGTIAAIHIYLAYGHLACWRRATSSGCTSGRASARCSVDTYSLH